MKQIREAVDKAAKVYNSKNQFGEVKAKQPVSFNGRQAMKMEMMKLAIIIRVVVHIVAGFPTHQPGHRLC